MELFFRRESHEWQIEYIYFEDGHFYINLILRFGKWRV